VGVVGHSISPFGANLRWHTAIIVHNVSERTRLLHLATAHKGKVSGLCFASDDRLLSCGVDRNIKLWDTTPSGEDSSATVCAIF
jgi:WD repeat and SOF domain-containing protein 1